MALTAGILLINQLIPTEFQFKDTDIINSKKLKEHLLGFAKKYPKKYSANISKITSIGEKISYYLGSNVGLEDLEIGGEKSAKKVESIAKAADKEHDVEKKRDILLNGFQSIVKDVEADSKDSKDSEILMQIASGSRGKPAQAARASIAPIYAVDIKQLPKNIVIKNSFSNGLSPVEYFNVASQGRFSSVSAANATAEPGALSKIIVANTEDQIITINDCKTKNGIDMSSKDSHIIGRYMANNGKLITSGMYRTLSRTDKKIKVRSPITCEAMHGICAKCYGMRANGQPVKIGDNVGIEAAQTIGQILTQMTLSTKHSTMGKNTGEAKLEGIPGFNALFSSKESADGMAISADASGPVTSIINMHDGSKSITIGGKKHTIPKGKKIIVSIGQNVSKGEPLSNGVEAPNVVLHNKGIYKAREVEAKEAHGIFQRSTGKDLQKKHFEVVSRGHFSLAKDEDGGFSNYDERMSGYPRRKQIRKVDDKILGMYLGSNIDYIPKGTEITEDFLKKLTKWKIRQVIVTSQRPPVKPMYKSLEQRPLFNNNLFAKMNYRGIGKAVSDQLKFNDGASIVSDKSRYTAHF